MFIKCRPIWITQTDHLPQFACTDGFKFEWMHDAMNETLQDEAKSCDDYQELMGLEHTCRTCSTCTTIELTNVPTKQLLHQLCCSDQPPFACVKVDCTKSTCFSATYRRLTVGYDGCNTLNIDAVKVVCCYTLGSFKDE